MQFLDRCNLDFVVRARQVVETGYEFFAGRKLVTLFSAPNYCNEFNNAGAMLTIDKHHVCSFEVIQPGSIVPEGKQ